MYLINQLSTNPKRLFLLDGIGALISAFFLGGVLVQLESLIGMPVQVLYVLAGMALIFAGYSLSCYANTPLKWTSYLKVITVTNSLYCCLTLGLVIYHFERLTLLGLTYFILEMIVIILLVRIETLILLRSDK